MSQDKLGASHHPRPQWRSRMGFILAALGSAVGLGNIWRFSYLCYENGGGAFLIPYLIALFVVGVPLLILELGIGHKMRGSAPLTFAKISRKWEWCGWWSVNCAMYGIMLYYAVIIAWCLSYVFFSFDLSWGSDPNAFFFNEYLQKSSDPFHLGDIRAPIIFSLLVVWFLSWLIVFLGVQKGVERANKIFMPLLFVLIFVLVAWSWNLKGAGIGRAVYLNPNFELLKNPKVWIAAFSQIFFTLSLAFGIMTTYASYLPRKVDIIKDAWIIGIGNCMFSIFAGFAVFSTLGYMAGTTGKPIEEVVTQSIGLAFVAYPQAISLMPGITAKIFGVLFFTSLVIAGLSSAVSLVEAFTSAVVDKFHYSRKTVVSVVCITGFLGSGIFAAESGIAWVDIVDHFITQYGLVIVGVLECILVGWIWKAKRLQEHIRHSIPEASTNALDRSIKFITDKSWKACIKFIIPVVLIILLFNNLKLEFSSPYGEYPWTFIILIGEHWLLVALIVSFFIAMRPWKKEPEDVEE